MIMNVASKDNLTKNFTKFLPRLRF